MSRIGDFWWDTKSWFFDDDGWIITLISVIVVFFVVMMVWSVSNPEPPDPRIQQCEQSGGIATTSAWDSRLTNCIYPPRP